MARKRSSSVTCDCHPVTIERWADMQQLFGANGACGGCWCMLWRLPRKQFDAQKGEGNKSAMQALLEANEVPGLLAYLDGTPVGWCAIAPRMDYPGLARSRILKPVDEMPVWSITCLFVDKSQRRKGISVQLLRAAIEHVRNQGGKVVEGYPVEPKKNDAPAVFVWTGLASAFRAVGFVEVARRSDTRPIMRYEIE
jgi:GNAT superfamily N-acetyltransferase